MAHRQSLESEQFSKSSNNAKDQELHSGVKPKIEFHFLTLFPEVFSGVLDSSLLGKAQKKGLVSYQLVQIRDFAEDKHRTVDDTPYGGGEGMLLKPNKLYSAWRSVVPNRPSPQSKKKLATILLS